MSTWLYVLIILLSALAIWYSGTKLVLYVDKIGDRIQLGKAFLGALLLGGITSLPELSTTIVASYLGNGPLAAANLLGGVSMQTAILAVADFILLKKALTYVSPRPVLIMGGVLLIFQLAFVMICVVIGEIISFYGIGLWGISNFALFLVFLFVLKKYEGQERWVVSDIPEIDQTTSQHKRKDLSSFSNTQIGFRIILHSIPVVIGGILISYSANALIEATGLSSTFVGASIVAITTSLPEVTTTFYAIRLNAYTLAISNIFGSNSLMIALLFVADIFYTKGLIFNSLNKSTIFICSIGILVTASYLWGLLERRNRTFLRMGIDSIIVILIEILGLSVLYFMH